MRPAILSLTLVLSMAALAAACPPVAVSSFGVQSTCGVQSFAVAQPQVAVQSFAFAQPVQVQTFAVQAQAVAFAQPVHVQAVCASGGCVQAARVGRQGILGRVLGSRSRSVARSVSVNR